MQADTRPATMIVRIQPENVLANILCGQKISQEQLLRGVWYLAA
jgi:hypothetical protein